jgi:hypothetical protein
MVTKTSGTELMVEWFKMSGDKIANRRVDLMPDRLLACMPAGSSNEFSKSPAVRPVSASSGVVSVMGT